MSPMKIMFDMDGVLCDFAYWSKYNHVINEDNSINWTKVATIGSSFWSAMPWLSEGKKLYNLVLDYRKTHKDIEIGIHSAVDLLCGKIDKYDWVKKNCSIIDLRNVKIDNCGNLKYVTGKNDEILIDDLEENVKSYVEAGFHAVLFTTAEETFKIIIKLIEKKNIDITI